jgi:hypothetical protein
VTDYHPFLVREVSKLHRHAGESRREVYERAREELVAKLHQPVLRIAESEVAGELRAFDAAVSKIEAEIARGQILETGVPALMTSGTSLDFTGSTPTIGIEAESLKITQTEIEAAQISRVKEAKSASPAATTNADPDRQMLHAIGAALDRTVHPALSTKAIGTEQTELPSTKADFPGPRAHESSGPLAQTNFPDPSSRDESVGPGGTILHRPQDAVVAPGEGADFDCTRDLPPRAHPGVAIVRTLRTQLTNMTLAIVICSVVFAVIYFAVDIGKWLGF